MTPGSEPADGVRAFYDDLAPTYDRIFADWRASSRRQGEVLSAVLAGELGPGPHRVADVACGIGTQLIGLATAGHLVCGSDVSMRAVGRAAAHVADAVAAGSFAASRVAGLAVADMRALPYADGCFDAVVCADNSLPHLLTPDGARTALGQLRRVLRSGGVAVVTTRDYDTLAVERPTTSGPQVSRDAMGRRAVTVQLWDWSADASTYALTHVQSVESAADRWATTARRTVYRAWSRAELTDLAAAGGFATSRWLTPQASGWYQPVLLARA